MKRGAVGNTLFREAAGSPYAKEVRSRFESGECSYRHGHPGIITLKSSVFSKQLTTTITVVSSTYESYFSYYSSSYCYFSHSLLLSLLIMLVSRVKLGPAAGLGIWLVGSWRSVPAFWPDLNRRLGEQLSATVGSGFLLVSSLPVLNPKDTSMLLRAICVSPP